MERNLIDGRKRAGVRRGSLALTLAVSAGWGMLPLFWRLLSHVDPLVILCCRVLFSALCGCVMLALSGRLGVLARTLTDRRTMRWLIPAAIGVTGNWGLYIWAVNAGRVLDASLGSYMNPLMLLACGLIVFREPFTRIELAAIVLAVAGVTVTAVSFGVFPTVAVLIAAFFTVFAVLQKIAGVDGVVAITIETLVMTPPALLYLLLAPAGAQTAAGLTVPTALLLVCAGPVTAVPLMLYARGVNDLPFATVGFIQYVTPTLMFFVGVLFMNETVTPARLAAFVCIWAALGLYTAGLLRAERRNGEKAGKTIRKPEKMP